MDDSIIPMTYRPDPAIFAPMASAIIASRSTEAPLRHPDAPTPPEPIIGRRSAVAPVSSPAPSAAEPVHAGTEGTAPAGPFSVEPRARVHRAARADEGARIRRRERRNRIAVRASVTALILAAMVGAGLWFSRYDQVPETPGDGIAAVDAGLDG